MRIAWERHGSGEPLLLIHGLGYARWGWEPVVEPLARSFDVILFDNRGIGESDVPDCWAPFEGHVPVGWE